MFRPNLYCTVYPSSGQTDGYGQPILGVGFKDRCSVVKLDVRNQKSSVRADTSASRGNAYEEIVIGTILMPKTTQANIDDIIRFSELPQSFRIVSKFPQHNVRGAMDHFQMDLVIYGGELA